MDQQKEVLFTVGGMHCAACSSRLERVLNGMDGVQSATVSLAANSATVVPDPALSESDTEALVHQIEERAVDMGFTATPVAPEADMVDTWEAQQKETVGQLATLKARLWPEFGFTILLLLVSMGHMWGLPAARDHRSHAFARVGPQPCAAATCADLAGLVVGAAFLFDRPAQPVAAHPEHGQPCGDGHGSGVPVQPVEYGRGRAWAYGQGDGPVL